MVTADALSRAHLNEADNDVNYSLRVLDITVRSNMSDQRKSEFVKESQKDLEIQTVKSLIKTQWPVEIKDVPDLAKAYHTFHNSIYKYGGMLFKDNCIIVPKSMRQNLLEKLQYNQ